jgi:hypothetical protein
MMVRVLAAMYDRFGGRPRQLRTNVLEGRPRQLRTNVLEGRPRQLRTNVLEGRPYQLRTNVLEGRPYQLRTNVLEGRPRLSIQGRNHRADWGGRFSLLRMLVHSAMLQYAQGLYFITFCICLFIYLLFNDAVSCVEL